MPFITASKGLGGEYASDAPRPTHHPCFVAVIVSSVVYAKIALTS